MQYLCQPDILLLYGVLQAVAEGSGQQQICGLADHIVHLRGAAEETERRAADERQRQNKQFKSISQSENSSVWKKPKCQPTTQTL